MNSELLKLPEEILNAEVRAICKRYRVDPQEARRILERNFASRPDLVHKIVKSYPEEDVTRFSDYKKVIKNARKQVYYHLRQYHRAKEREDRLKKKLGRVVGTWGDPEQVKQIIADLLRTHASTRERFDHYKKFYKNLFDLIEPPRAILDVGCGVHPLSYPFNKRAERPEIYVAIDKDPNAIETLTVFAPCVTPARLMPMCADFAAIRWADYLVDEIDLFDIAFMLKLIPVIHRQRRELLPKLVEVPARQVLITASAEAMTRKEYIARREDRVLRDFIEMTGRQIAGTFRIENEFGYLLMAR